MKRVLLIGCNDLITSGIESLIQNAYDVVLLYKVIKNIPDLIDEIINFKPDILVLKNNINYVNSSSMMELLGKFPDLRILAIDEKINIIHVYERQEVRVKQSADLLELIRKTNHHNKETIITR